MSLDDPFSEGLDQTGYDEDGGWEPRGAEDERLQLVMDIPIEVSVELGRRKMLLGEVVRLGNGAIVELGKASGEPLDIVANGHLIAHGEAVVVGDKYGVRITEILSAGDRFRRVTRDRKEGR